MFELVLILLFIFAYWFGQLIGRLFRSPIQDTNVYLGETHIILGKKFTRVNDSSYCYYRNNDIGFYIVKLGDQEKIYYWLSDIIPITQEEFVQRLEGKI
jgi:hypothetical protein